MLRVLLTIGIGGPVLGALFAWYGFKERAVAQESSPTPETMTLSQLIARGPNGNANVVVTDFVMVPDHAVERGRRSRVTGTWVPIVPRDAGLAGGSPRALKALVYCDGSGGPEDAYARASGPRLAGLVINKIKTPKDSVEEHFQKSYPQTDFSTCIYIQEGREPTSETTATLMIFGGIGAAVIGLGALVLALFVWQKNKAKEALQKKSRKKGRFRDEEEDDDRPRKRRSAAKDDEDEDRPRKRRAAEDDEDEVPRKKRRPAVDEDDEKPSRRRAARDDDEDEPPRKKRRPADDEDDDRPRRRPRRDD